MALVGTLTFANTAAAANTGAITISSGWTGSTPSVGNIVDLFFCIDKTSANPTISGVTASSPDSIADTNVACAEGTTSLGVRSWVWAGTETTIQLATAGSHFYAVGLIATSGRSSTPYTVTPAITTPPGIGGGSPQSLSITGLTANAQDDLVLCVGGNQQATTSDTFTLTAPSGFTNVVNVQAAATANGTQLAICIKANVSAGATGTLSGSLSSTAGEGLNYGAYLLSLALASVGPPPIAPFGPMPKQLYIMP